MDKDKRYCEKCFKEMPLGRPYKLCVKCNKPNVGKRYAQSSTGFKANGANVVPLEEAEEEQANNPIRGI